MKTAVLIFPDSNCDHDAHYVSHQIMQWESHLVWHQETELPPQTDLVVIPGGFSYGDYLRCGAIASLAPIMKAVRRHADQGGLVLGICNGFQILCEARLLPGALIRNRDLRFIHEKVQLKTERLDLPFTQTIARDTLLTIPIAHAEGNYVCDEATMVELEKNRQVVFRYAHPNGHVDDASAPNGSTHAIAGIVNKQGNILGMMPHPERACEQALGMTDGLRIFQSMEQHVSAALIK